MKLGLPLDISNFTCSLTTKHLGFGSYLNISFTCIFISRVRWVLVTTAYRVLRLRMEERLPIWRVAANILNTQSRTADKGWSSSLGVGRGANNSSP